MCDENSELKTVIKNLMNSYPNAIFLFDGDSAWSGVKVLKHPNTVKFLAIRDYMGTGKAAPEILSEKYISLRTKEFNYHWHKRRYSEYDYIRDCASVLQEISQYKKSEIFLVQYDCYLSHIWQLTMQAYIEQIGLSDHVTRITFTEDTVAYKFITNEIDKISITDSHEAYCELVCKHEYTDLRKYLIPEKAVRCYLDINSPTGELNSYILNETSKIDSPYGAYGIFAREYAHWGLGDLDFIKIAYLTLSQEPKFKRLIEKWDKKFIHIE